VIGGRASTLSELGGFRRRNRAGWSSKARLLLWIGTPYSSWQAMQTNGRLPWSRGARWQAVFLLVSGCERFSPQITKMYLIYIISLLVLFVQFFIKSYSGKGKGSKKDKSL
jgi:hypothetical protein